MRLICLFITIATISSGNAQSIEVTFDKTKDMSGYKTFRIGESEVTTPADMRVLDEKELRGKVDEIITQELKEKGLQRVDSNAQLVVSFIIGYLERSGVYNAGPLGGTPGEVSSGAVMKDYNEGSFVVDLNDKSNNLIWRINSIIQYSATVTVQQVEQVVDKGFRKFPNKPKKKGKK